MTIHVLGFFALMANTEVDLGAFESLVKNAPDDALKVYQIAIAREDLPVQDLYQLHYQAIRASASTFNNVILIEAIDSLKTPPFKALADEDRAKILTNIGVGYRRRNQNEQAIWHYRCAMNATASLQQKSALKVNIAIAYTRLEQPAIGYRLLKSVDREMLPSFMQAGLLTALGNATFALGEVDKALSYFIEAATHYAQDENYRAVKQVSINSLGIYVLHSDFSSYHKVLADIASEPSLIEDNQHYLGWLRELVQQLEQNKQGLTESTTMKAYSLGAANKGYAAMVNAHIDKFNLSLPKVTSQLTVRDPLPVELGKAWCPSH
ncbi:hypothetical protein [Pseudoalteromonas sp. S2755]|uniref:hypothetical protein n=1 Tax=Pseudoalteromonas sp. S2755 TaxID=2066523 RepID=UPI00110A4425|nr:hypothetical protein [Pseudoalteromonas sp. S2755]TMN37285.1 hypothetical protein CWC03_12635 [Pseudoalteromonas sp. S2755]